MKYRKWMIVTLWVVLALVACTATPVPETPHPTATETMVVPTETPIPTETPKPTETPAPQIEYAWECWDGGPVSCPSEPILPANEMTFGNSSVF